MLRVSGFPLDVRSSLGFVYLEARNSEKLTGLCSKRMSGV